MSPTSEISIANLYKYIRKSIPELTESERNKVYWEVCELVKNSLEKAGSV
jgi:hypothetical protein